MLLTMKLKTNYIFAFIFIALVFFFFGFYVSYLYYENNKFYNDRFYTNYITNVKPSYVIYTYDRYITNDKILIIIDTNNYQNMLYVNDEYSNYVYADVNYKLLSDNKILVYHYKNTNIYDFKYKKNNFLGVSKNLFDSSVVLNYYYRTFDNLYFGGGISISVDGFYINNISIGIYYLF